MTWRWTSGSGYVLERLEGEREGVSDTWKHTLILSLLSLSLKSHSNSLSLTCSTHI